MTAEDQQRTLAPPPGSSLQAKRASFLQAARNSSYAGRGEGNGVVHENNNSVGRDTAVSYGRTTTHTNAETVVADKVGEPKTEGDVEITDELSQPHNKNYHATAFSTKGNSSSDAISRARARLGTDPCLMSSSAPVNGMTGNNNSGSVRSGGKFIRTNKKANTIAAGTTNSHGGFAASHQHAVIVSKLPGGKVMSLREKLQKFKEEQNNNTNGNNNGEMLTTSTNTAAGVVETVAPEIKKKKKKRAKNVTAAADTFVTSEPIDQEPTESTLLLPPLGHGDGSTNSSGTSKKNGTASKKSKKTQKPVLQTGNTMSFAPMEGEDSCDFFDETEKAWKNQTVEMSISNLAQPIVNGEPQQTARSPSDTTAQTSTSVTNSGSNSTSTGGTTTSSSGGFFNPFASYQPFFGGNTVTFQNSLAAQQMHSQLNNSDVGAENNIATDQTDISGIRNSMPQMTKDGAFIVGGNFSEVPDDLESDSDEEDEINNSGNPTPVGNASTLLNDNNESQNKAHRQKMQKRGIATSAYAAPSAYKKKKRYVFLGSVVGGTVILAALATLVSLLIIHKCKARCGRSPISTKTTGTGTRSGFTFRKNGKVALLPPSASSSSTDASSKNGSSSGNGNNSGHVFHIHNYSKKTPSSKKKKSTAPVVPKKRSPCDCRNAPTDLCSDNCCEWCAVGTACVAISTVFVFVSWGACCPDEDCCGCTLDEGCTGLK